MTPFLLTSVVILQVGNVLKEYGIPTVVWMKEQENMLGGCPDFSCFNIKRFPKDVLQPPSPKVFKPQLDKALMAGPEPRAEHPEQDLGLGPS